MGGLLPKAPKPIAAPPEPEPIPIPTPESERVLEAERLARQRALSGKGRAGTILSGPSGVNLPPTYVNTLLGE